MSASTIAVTDAAHRFGRTQALSGVTFSAYGGVTTLLGPNGAGKTTLLRGVATVIGFGAGDVRVDGMDPNRSAERIEIRRRLGYLPQNPAFNPHGTVYDVVDYIAVLKGSTDRRARRVDVRRVLGLVGLTGKREERVRDLSGGMRQRLGLAAALLGDPSLVVLDEPAVSLDPEQRLLLREQVSLLGERATVLVSTHLTDEAAAISRELHVMDEGRIVFSGTPAQLAATAQGRVWLSEQPPASSAHMSWRTGEGLWRCLGTPPPGSVPGEPSLEDGYLLLVGRSGVGSEAA